MNLNQPPRFQGFTKFCTSVLRECRSWGALCFPPPLLGDHSESPSLFSPGSLPVIRKLQPRSRLARGNGHFGAPLPASQTLPQAVSEQLAHFPHLVSKTLRPWRWSGRSTPLKETVVSGSTSDLFPSIFVDKYFSPLKGHDLSVHVY